jgi:UDP-GlcNAc:undecaprenyl-phosphate GlcNAc-1-phosphate transferase
MIINPYFAALIGFTITVLVIIAASPIARKIGLLDQPNNRKHHQGNVPLTGGIAISVGFCISILILNISLSPFRSLLAGFLLLTLTGVMDDFNELSARTRIISQTLAGLLVTCWGGLLLTQLGHLFGPITNFNLGAWAVPFTIVAIMALINANNMLDGLNGLAGGTSFVTLGCLICIANRSQVPATAELLFTLCACLLGFLCFNFPIFRYRKRLVFLGDAGSTGLGLMMAWFGIQLSQPPFNFLKPAYLPWLFIVPIFDLISVTLRRLIIKRHSVFVADREHTHHLLQKIGLRNSFITLTLITIALAGGLIAIFMAQYHFSEGLSFALFINLFLMYFLSSNFYWHKLRKSYD